MYTVLWIDGNGNDRWERCESREEVNELLEREDIREADTWIFTPRADDFAVTGDIWLEATLQFRGSDENA